VDQLGVGGGRLDDQVALITGAGSGIGRAMAREFAARGARIAACDIDRQTASAAARDAADAGAPEAIAVTADVGSAPEAARVIDKVQRRFERIDVLCSNAGILDGYASAIDATEELWDRVFDVNVKATWLLARAALPQMRERKSGAIIVTASVAGMVAGGGGVAYTSSKHAVIGLMRQIALENAPHGIRVNAICPGVVQTGMTQPLFDDKDSIMYEFIPAIPSATWAQPEEIAKLAALMASGEVPFMRGACVVADGGWTIK
jgi:NAD(P)-dependent dehydrogenase (short-subunit alcohol dehydrogenase family)